MLHRHDNNPTTAAIPTTAIIIAATLALAVAAVSVLAKARVRIRSRRHTRQSCGHIGLLELGRRTSSRGQVGLTRPTGLPRHLRSRDRAGPRRVHTGMVDSNLVGWKLAGRKLAGWELAGWELVRLDLGQPARRQTSHPDRDDDPVEGCARHTEVTDAVDYLDPFDAGAFQGRSGVVRHIGLYVDAGHRRAERREQRGVVSGAGADLEDSLAGSHVDAASSG